MSDKLTRYVQAPMNIFCLLRRVNIFLLYAVLLLLIATRYAILEMETGPSGFDSRTSIRNECDKLGY